MDKKGPLAGHRIVVTRPRDQAAALGRSIEQAGGTAFAFPAIEIGPLPDTRAALATLDRLESFELAVFVSSNAVRMAFRLMAERRPGWHWPSRVPAAGVGGGTAEALAIAGVTRVLKPSSTSDSEGLLALPELTAVKGMRVAIFRGQGGRALLGDTLKERGASVSYVECYVRRLPACDPAPLLEHLRAGRVDAVTVSSSEGLRNLCALLGAEGGGLLRDTPLFVSHPRVAEQARGLGLERPCVAGPSDAETLRALVAYFSPAK